MEYGVWRRLYHQVERTAKVAVVDVQVVALWETRSRSFNSCLDSMSMSACRIHAECGPFWQLQNTSKASPLVSHRRLQTCQGLGVNATIFASWNINHLQLVCSQQWIFYSPTTVVLLALRIPKPDNDVLSRWRWRWKLFNWPGTALITYWTMQISQESEPNQYLVSSLNGQAGIYMIQPCLRVCHDVFSCTYTLAHAVPFSTSAIISIPLGGIPDKQRVLS